MDEPSSDAHLPNPVPIEGYGRGGFRFGEMSHTGSILCLPSGIWRWSAATVADIDVASLDRVFAESARIDMLLVGTGRTLVPLPEALRWRLRDVAIGVECMATGVAIPTWNLLLGEGRRVAAALLAVD